MQRTMLKSKIHRATITDCDLHYVGSITIDPDLLEAADIREHEQVHVLDIDNGARFETYTIVLPVKGDYAQLRRFCEKVLMTVPYAALDDMRFKRSSTNDQTVEASLRFTVFLRPAFQGTSTTLIAAGEAHK